MNARAFSEALTYLNDAVEAQPASKVAYLRRSLTKEALGDTCGAMADLDVAVTINPRYASAFCNRGNLKANHGDKDGAFLDYAQAPETEA